MAKNRMQPRPHVILITGKAPDLVKEAVENLIDVMKQYGAPGATTASADCVHFGDENCSLCSYREGYRAAITELITLMITGRITELNVGPSS